MPESSRRSWALMVMSSRNRPAGRIRSSRWHHRSACRSRGRTGVSSRKTWWLMVKARTNWSGCDAVGKRIRPGYRSRRRVWRSARGCGGD
jgi:hypothetical protein